MSRQTGQARTTDRGLQRLLHRQSVALMAASMIQLHKHPQTTLCHSKIQTVPSKQVLLHQTVNSVCTSTELMIQAAMMQLQHMTSTWMLSCAKGPPCLVAQLLQQQAAMIASMTQQAYMVCKRTLEPQLLAYRRPLQTDSLPTLHPIACHGATVTAPVHSPRPLKLLRNFGVHLTVQTLQHA